MSNVHNRVDLSILYAENQKNLQEMTAILKLISALFICFLKPDDLLIRPESAK